MFQRPVLVFIAALTLAFLPACDSATDSPSDQSEPLTVGTMYWPGMFWIDIALEKGWFSEAGLDVEPRALDADYYGGMDDVAAGELDTMTVWLFDIVKYNLDGAGMVKVLVSDISHGSEAIVARPGIEDAGDLAGKKVGVSSGTGLEYQLAIMLEYHGLRLADITRVDGAPEEMPALFESGEVDAVITWFPHVQETMELDGQVLFDSSEIPGLMFDGLVFREDFIAQRPEDVQRFVNVWHRSSRLMRTEPEQAWRIIAERYDTTPDEVAEFAEKNLYPDLQENLRAFTYASGLESLFGSTRRINQFLLRETDVKETINGIEFLDSRFLRALEDEQ